MSKTIKQGDNQTMSQRPTPETDARSQWLYANVSPTNNQRFVAMTKWAEELEQQRDEARERCEAMERAGAEQARRADENREWALIAQRERDEAIAKLQPLINA